MTLVYYTVEVTKVYFIPFTLCTGTMTLVLFYTVDLSSVQALPHCDFYGDCVPHMIQSRTVFVSFPNLNVKQHAVFMKVHQWEIVVATVTITVMHEVHNV